VAGAAVAAVAVATAGTAALASDGDRTPAARAAIKGGTARNVILFIGDGMGDSEITAARNYAKGAAGRLNMDALPLTGEYTTYSVQKDHPAKPQYVTDSAASGTGWSTGHKTYNGAISVDPSGRPLTTILEKAKRAGFRTGDVSTAEIEDATPAVLGSHVTDRSCYGPDDVSKTCPANATENGGAGSIAEQLTAHDIDVVLGGGKKAYGQTIKAGRDKGRTVLQAAKARGQQVVTDAAGLSHVRAGHPVLGLFADGNMDVEWTGPKAKSGGTEPSRCTPNAARAAGQPHLPDMTRTAIQLLDANQAKSKRGFFLQVEGASIDKQDHAADPCGQIGETVGFDDAIRVGRSYAARHPDTLVVVTADHGHTSQIIEATTSPGQTATLITKDGAEMNLNYATAPAGESQGHTGTEVRIAAQGPQAANVLGVTDQTGLFRTMTRAIGVR
jgi:alkaline phosphatase